MRCDLVIRELAVPTDDRDSAALAEHLAICPSCAGWANRAGRLDRLWEATRPTDPPAEMWDTVWARVASSLDSSTPSEVKVFSLAVANENGSMAKAETPVVPAHSPARSRPWNLAVIGFIGFAQAAAILLVVGLTWHRSTTSEQPSMAKAAMSPSFFPESPTARKIGGPSSDSVVEIDEGRLVVIHVEDSAVKIVDLTPQAASYRLEKRLRNLESALVDDWLLMLNEVESMTKPLVAMKE
jgi:hypothetical protein